MVFKITSENPFGEENPHGWIQWKGTNVCMDVRCECGYISHIDDDFTYYIRCPMCKKAYACNPHIKLHPLTSKQEKEAMEKACGIKEEFVDDYEKQEWLNEKSSQDNQKG